MVSVGCFHGYPDAQTEHPYQWMGIIYGDEARYFYSRVGVNLIPNSR